MTRTRLFQNLLQIGALEELTGEGQFFKQLTALGQVTGLVEHWQRTAVKISGVLLIDAGHEIDVAGFRFSVGLEGTQSLPLPFSFELPRTPVALLLAAMSLRAGLLDQETAVEFFGQQIVNDTITFISKQASVFDTVSLSLGPLPVFLGLPTDWFIRGQYVRNVAGDVTGVEALPEALPVKIALGAARFKLSARDIELAFEASESFQVAPLIIRGTGIALEVGITQFFSATDRKPDAILNRTGFDSGWSGVSLKSLKVWGLESIFPPLADGRESTVVALEDWLVDGRGMTGSVVFASPSTKTEMVRVDELRFGFDRTWWPVELTLNGNVDVGSWVGAAPKRLDAIASLRLNPMATDSWGRYSLEIFLTPDQTAGKETGAIVQLDQDLAALGATAAAIAALTDSTDITLVLGALAALDTAGVMTWKTFSLTAVQLTLAFVPPSATGAASLALTGQLRLASKVAFEIDGNDEPVPVELDTGAIAFSWHIATAQVQADWTLKQGFGVSIPAAVDIGGILIIDRVGVALEEANALRIEFGVQPAGTGEVAITGLPDVFGFIYRPGGLPEIEPFVRRESQPLVVLVPGVLYASGTLSRGGSGLLPGGGSDWGDVLKGRVRAFLIARKEITDPADYLKKDSYSLDLDIAILMATRVSDGLQAVVITIDAGFRPGIPIGNSGVNLYGLGLTYAQNGRPNAIDGDFASWFMDTPEAFSTNALKWVPEADNWGFGAAVTLGSAPDTGTAFNVAAGLFLLLPGPVVMLTGRANVFDVLPKLPAEVPKGKPQEEVKAAFAATVVLDFLRDRFEVDLRADVKKTLGPVTLLDISAPSEIFVDLKNPKDFHLYLGEVEPPSARATATGLNIPDLDAYLMFDGKGLTLPPDALSLPGPALAMGASAGFNKGFSFGPLALSLEAAIGFDLAMALALPPLARGRAYAQGTLSARAFGIGAYLEAGVTFEAVAPSPFSLKGEAYVRIEMPWFVPDIDVRAQLEIGSEELTWPSNYPLPTAANPVEQLSFVANGESPMPIPSANNNSANNTLAVTQNVPIDAGLVLAFNVPMGNEQVKVGNVTTNGSDRGAPVWVVTTAGDTPDERIGHRYVLSAIALVEKTSLETGSLETGSTLVGTNAVETIAKWTRETHAGNQPGASLPRTKGGIVDRSTLQLLTVDKDHAVRLSGQAAAILKEHFTAFDPCQRAEKLKQLVSTYTLEDTLEQQKGPVVFEPITPVIPDRRDRVTPIDSPEVNPPVLDSPIFNPTVPNFPVPNFSTSNFPTPNFSVLNRPLLRRENREIAFSLTPTADTTPRFDVLDLLTRRAVPLTFGQPHRLVNDTDARLPAILFDVLPPKRDAVLLRSMGQGRTQPAAAYDTRVDITSPVPAAAEQKPLLQLPTWLIHKPSMPAENGLERELTILRRLAIANGNPAGSLHFTLPRLAQAEVYLAVWEGATLIAEAQTADGSRQPVQSELVPPSQQNAHRLFIPGAPTETTREWRIHLIRTDAQTSELTLSAAVVITAAIETSLASVKLPLVGLLGVRLISEPPQVAAALERATSSYRSVLEMAVDQQNDWLAGGTAGLLKPDTEYTLAVLGTLQAARQRKGGALELGGPIDTFTENFVFRTAKAPTDVLTPYRGPVERDLALTKPGSLEDHWQIAVMPSDAGPRHYLDNDISLRFREARTLGMLNAYGLAPVLRLKGEDGSVNEFSPMVSLRSATDLQADEAALRERHLSTPCYDVDIHREVVMDIAASLRPNTRYEAMLVGQKNDDRTIESLLHRWHFTTSRFANLREQFAAYKTVDEVFVDDGHRRILQALTEIGPRLTLDSVTIDHLLFDILSLPARPSPEVPELIRLWSWDATNNQAVLRALLLDGPEALMAADDQLALIRGSTTMALSGVSDALGARILVAIAPATPGDYQLRLMRSNSQSSRQSAMRLLSLPERPAVLEDLS